MKFIMQMNVSLLFVGPYDSLTLIFSVPSSKLKYFTFTAKSYICKNYKLPQTSVYFNSHFFSDLIYRTFLLFRDLFVPL